MNVSFLGNTRFGSGVIVARLDNGRWSPPSAVATGGVGFGGQIGAEITDFVFILNSTEAVQTFMHGGSLMLGVNASAAMGPIGRSVELDRGASLKGAASIFSYSKNKGLFGGVSVEGTVLVESSSANKKLYNREVKAKQLLNGEIVPPPEVDRLMRVLASDAFNPDPQTLDPPENRVELPAGAQNQPPAELEAESRSPRESDSRHRSRIEHNFEHSLPAELESGTRSPIELDTDHPLPGELDAEPRLLVNAPA